MSRLVRAVFFDVDQTLLDTPTTARLSLRAVFDEDVDIATWDAITEAQYEHFNSGAVEFPAMMTARMADFLATRGEAHDLVSAEATEQVRNQRFIENTVVYHDVEACLRGLRRRGLKLGVISNSSPEHQRRKLAAAGLADSFDAVVISGELGVAKPDPAIFEHACAAIAVTPNEAMHVGDRLDTDALGATAAGMLGVWLDRQGIDAGERRVPVVSDLAALDGLLP